MTISLRRAAFASLLIAALSGCSTFNKKGSEYLESVSVAPLKIPAGLDNPTGPSPMTIGVPEMRMPEGDELAPGPPRVASTAGKEDANAYIAWSPRGAYLLVKDTPDSVSRRLRHAIENAGMTLLKAGDSGAYKFHYTQPPPPQGDAGFFSHMAFWRSKPEYIDFSGTFMTNVEPDGQNTRVYLLFGTGEPVDTAGCEHILGIFMDRLG
jgi:uncharacterized lipoprotein